LPDSAPIFSRPRVDDEDLESGVRRPPSPSSFDDEETDELAAKIVDSYQKVE